jgi:hypothetical protein
MKEGERRRGGEEEKRRILYSTFRTLDCHKTNTSTANAALAQELFVVGCWLFV